MANLRSRRQLPPLLRLLWVMMEYKHGPFKTHIWGRESGPVHEEQESEGSPRYEPLAPHWWSATYTVVDSPSCRHGKVGVGQVSKHEGW